MELSEETEAKKKEKNPTQPKPKTPQKQTAWKCL